jgi:two-component system, sensor histidine kinase
VLTSAHSSWSLPDPGRVLSLVVAAALLNLVPIELFGDARVLLGPFLVMPLVLVLPWPWAVVVAALPASVTLLTLQHPFVLVLAALEALWLASARSGTTRRVLLRWSLFWVFVGVPLGLWLYDRVAGLPSEVAALWLTARVVNQFSAVVVGHFLVHHTLLFAWTHSPIKRVLPLRALVFNYVFVLTAVPLALTGLGFASLLRQEADVKNATQLLGLAERVAQDFTLFLTVHQEALVAVANLAQRAPEHATLFLEEQHRAHRHFITMLMADQHGRIEATAPTDALVRLRGMDISDRDYFQRARDTLNPQITGVFRGRGFGNDVLIGLSVPVLSSSGAFERLVQGSVEIGELARIAAQAAAANDAQFVLIDRNGRAIFASAELPVRPLDDIRGLPISQLQRPDQAALGVTYDIRLNGTPRRVRAFAATDDLSGITVVVQRPLLAMLAGATRIYVLLALVFTGVLFTAVVVARFARQRLSSPLEHFAISAAQQATGGEVKPMQVPEAPGMPQEVALVYAGFNQLAERLAQTLEELRRSNVELDQRVELRTRELEQARQAAEAASASKTRFLAMTSHEIRTPLNAIIGFADSLLEQVNDPVVLDRLQTIRSSGVLLLGVVNDLLDLSSVEAGRLELRPVPCDVDDLCRDLTRLFAHRAQQKGIRLEFEGDRCGQAWVRLDAQRLRQVLTNLLSNAVKFTSVGRIALEVTKQRLPDGRLRLHFAVLDTGPGIPMERQARLFEEFYRVEELREIPGTGLGLNISRRLVELMGGSISIESVVGVGSRFSFELTAESVPPPTAVVAQVAELRVLAVDDHPANQEVLRSMLDGRCSELTVVSSAAEALSVLSARSFDVALIDLEMPGIDGFQLMERLQEDRGSGARRGRAIAVSAHPRSQLIDRCRAAGFDDYIEKPIDRRLLWQVLRKQNPIVTSASAPGSAATN